MNEFVCVRYSTSYHLPLPAHLRFLCQQDFVIGLTIWAIIDPTNFMVSPVAGPWIIGFT